MIDQLENVVADGPPVQDSGSSRKGLFTFLLVWLGQSVSVIGSELTGFSLAVWVYQRTGSTTKFSLIAISTITPGILLAPLLGVVVDRYSRRMIMIVSNIISAVSTLAIALLFLAGNLQLWHICALMMVISISSNLLGPSYTASISSLVSKKYLGRAAGMVQFGQAAADMLGPLLAGFLIITIRLNGVLLIDFATYLFAILTLALVRFPRISALEEAGKKVSFWAEVSMGMRYIAAHSGLLALVGFFTFTNSVLGMENILKLPLVLSFAGAALYGTVISAGGTGMLLGSVMMSVWGGPKRRIYGVLLYGVILGFCLIIESLRPSVWLIAPATFCIAFASPMANGCAMPILQTKTALALQGRVFASVRFVVGLFVPVSYILAGRLADKVFGPLMASNGTLARSMGRIIGVGPGRGIALLLLTLGLLVLLATVRAGQYRPLACVETDIPDAIHPEPSAA